ncbi:MAG: hypothetical protein EOM90_07860 [Alphaproteobacteria bacterium]|nr:hypothetical protein [Alphaproteobacteria bacterium]
MKKVHSDNPGMLLAHRGTGIAIFLYPFLVLLLSVSCRYKPTDEFYHELHPVKPELTITGTLVNDTLFPREDGFIIVYAQASGKRKYYLEVFIDGVKKVGQQSDNGGFYFKASSILNPGIYHALLRVFCSTLSGSVADAANLEAFQYEREVTLLNNDFSGFNFIPSLLFTLNAGSLKCTLPAPTDSTPIRKMEVAKALDHTAGSIFYDLNTSTGIPPYSFFDPTYVGEQAFYSATTYTGLDGSPVLYPYRITVTEKECEWSNPTFTINDRGVPDFSWEKCRYSENFEGYRISVSPYPYIDFIESAMIPDINQNSYEINDIAFPGKSRVYISYVPKTPLPGYSNVIARQKYSVSNYVEAGKPGINFYEFLAPVGNDIFIPGSNEIIRYDAGTLTPVDIIKTGQSIKYSAVSPRNHFLLATMNAWNSDYLFYNVESKTKYTVPGNQIFGSSFEGGRVSISDQGLAALVGDHKIILYNFVNGQNLGEHTFSVKPCPVLSSSGTYLFVKADQLYLFSVSGGTLSEKWRSVNGPYGYLFYSFFPDDDNRAVILENQELVIRNCSDWSLVRSFTVEGSEFGNVDFNTERLLVYGYSNFAIYDLNTGIKIKQMKTGTSTPILRLRGNTIFWNKGKALVIF